MEIMWLKTKLACSLLLITFNIHANSTETKNINKGNQ
ncbi:putative membrane protein [Thalassotalea piscium]|uniref:Putative membrane protein n=1 Tax=Thalassotalea piscium TaxID=1230533 RepID=A0A7X0NIC2_9GAMM|nr:putative membrane protein [Thalassotalea piscium]